MSFFVFPKVTAKKKKEKKTARKAAVETSVWTGGMGQTDGFRCLGVKVNGHRADERGAAASHQHTCCDCTSLRVRAPAFVFGKSRLCSELAAVEAQRYTLHMTEWREE